MKRTRSDKAKTGIQWDEANLEENDKIKAEINPRKINEPKTPYHGPMEEEPGCGEPGMSPLRLEEEVTTALHSGLTYRQGHPKPDEPADAHMRFEEPTAEEGAYRADSAPSGESLHSYRSSEDGDHAGAEDTGRSAPNAEKKMRFADRRKDHYNMRSALKEGKELVTQLYHTNNVDERQNGADHHRPFHSDAEDSS